jgi:hypothetical protein
MYANLEMILSLWLIVQLIFMVENFEYYSSWLCRTIALWPECAN